MALKIQYKAMVGGQVDYTNICTSDFNYQRQKEGISKCEQWFFLGNKWFLFLMFMLFVFFKIKILLLYLEKKDKWITF